MDEEVKAIEGSTAEAGGFTEGMIEGLVPLGLAIPPQTAVEGGLMTSVSGKVVAEGVACGGV